MRKTSAEARAAIPARRKAIEVVKERDKVCQFEAHYRALHGFTSNMVSVFDVPVCYGPLDVHEPARRSQGADPTDPDQCVLLCRQHHSWVHAHPAQSYELGLLIRRGPSVTPLDHSPQVIYGDITPTQGDPK
jgi:hypothetical protein